MLRSWKLGKVFGIPLYIHSTFVLLPAWVLLHAALTVRGINPATALFLLAALAAVTACIVLHELGHALMARVFGIRTRDITLYPIGGVARLERMSERPAEELCIALAGPAVNVLIAGLLTPFVFLASFGGAMEGSEWFLIGPDTGLGAALGKFAANLWVTNILLVVFNLIPAFPMDGGRVLRALLSAVFGHLPGTEIAVRISLVMAVVLAVVGIIFLQSPMVLLIALFVSWAGQQELLALRHREAQRRLAHTAEPLDVLPAESAPGPDDAGAAARAPEFSGVVWDDRYRVWVHWRNGRPVAYWGPAE